MYKSQEQKIQKEKKHYTGIYSNSDERNLEHRCEEGELILVPPFPVDYGPLIHSALPSGAKTTFPQSERQNY